MSSNCKTKAAFTLNTHTHTHRDEVSGTYTVPDMEVSRGCLSWALGTENLKYNADQVNSVGLLLLTYRGLGLHS